MVNCFRIPVLGVSLLLAALLPGRSARANTATTPTPKTGAWLTRHGEFVREAHSEPIDVLFLGDSITDYWRRSGDDRAGKAAWDHFFAPLHAANFGLASDRTQHVLWRIENGEVDGLHPRVVVLLIGTNNTGPEPGSTRPRNTPAETAAGIETVVTELRRRLPSTRVLLLAVFPRGQVGDPQRAQIAEINRRVAAWVRDPLVTFLDIGGSFLNPDGTLPLSIMPDRLHPNARGYEIWAKAIKEPLGQLLSAGTVWAPGERVPIVDLSAETDRQTVVDREPGKYLGHVSTLLLDDHKTILAMYPQGHGRGPILFKRSGDGGLTWSARLATPANWTTSVEVPTLFQTVDASGRKRLLMFSGTGAGRRDLTVRMAESEDDGLTWSELRSIGPFGGIVTMSSMVRRRDGAYLAFFHDESRYLKGEPAVANASSGVLQTVSTDGGLTWSHPRVVAAQPGAFLCEPGALRSPDGHQIALIMRENTRRYHSFAVFSDDEGASWTRPRELPLALTGDRHVIRYDRDGRVVISFRDTAAGSATYGDWVAWVGTYADIAGGRPGQCRIRLMHNTATVDCGYSGLELLPDDTWVATTYGHWTAGEAPFIVSVRFRLDEIDRRLRNRSGSP